MRKKVLKVSAGVLLVLAVLIGAHKMHQDAHFFDNYDPNAPMNATILDQEEVGKDTPEKGYVITHFTFDGFQGEKVPALMSVPMKHAAGKSPAVIFLHGIGQNKNFLKKITAPFNQTGFVLVSFDQYMQGDRKLPKHSPILSFLKAFQERPAKTVNETRRLIDYLSTLPDIDPKRIYLVGASYGAVMGSTVMAKDKRLHAGVLVYGGGGFAKLLQSYANHLGVAALLHMIDAKSIDPEKPPVPTLTPAQDRIASAIIASSIVPIARYFMGASDPIHYADQISPTPVYFQNGTHDMLVPAAAAKALQEVAREPKKVTWYDSDHVGIDWEQTKRVLTDGLRWILEQDNPSREPGARVGELPSFEGLGAQTAPGADKDLK